MAAYAALISLLNNLDQIQNHPCHSFSFDEKQIKALREDVTLLVDFIEGYNSHGGINKEEAEVLESKIASAAHEAEDVIEYHVVDETLCGSTPDEETSSHLFNDLQKVIQEMDSIKKMAVKFKAQRECRDQLPTYSRSATLSRPLTTGKKVMVGFDDELVQLMERLTGQQPNRQIIPIVGMGGIGKTTLTRNVYENLLIVQHFDVRLWATISQEYSVDQILLELLYGQRKSTGEDVHELGEQLHKRLSGKRYLIILDDMWGIESWDEIKFFFPDNGNRSRIVITTRLSNMAIHFCSDSFVMNFLDEEKSWMLFCEKAFGEEGSPPELEEIGKKIVKNCRGLPLSIVVIGGHIGKSSREKEYWESVASDMKSILNSGEDELYLDILYLSYSHLPVYLKPCFLYMGIFDEDEKISGHELIRLWVAEGFLKPNMAKSLEEIAEGYLKDLVERNLILAHTWSRNGKIKTCGVHDLLRELCLKVAEKEKFLCVLDNPRAIHSERRVVIHRRIPEEKGDPEFFHALESAQLVRSLKCYGGEMSFDFALSFDFRLLRVLNYVEGIPRHDYECPLDAHLNWQVNLRYLDYYQFHYVFCRPDPSLNLPSSISSLWSLQTLIINGDFARVIAPFEIWEMLQLRHFESNLICLPEPLYSNIILDEEDDFVLQTLVLQNLQTLLVVENLELSERVCERIPNLRELHLWYDDFPSGFEASEYYFPHNLSRFHKLESLKLNFSKEANWRDFAMSLTFPSSLQELSFQDCFLHWEDLTMIGSLPHLEVLELGGLLGSGPEWNPIEGEFLRLKSLEIRRCGDLICWNADSSHFPALENLVLHEMSELEEIPSGIGEIPTLRFIGLKNCKVSAALSAMRILVEQESLGNEGLQLQVFFSKEEERERCREMKQLEGITSNNLCLE